MTKSSYTRIIVGGDLCPINRNEQYFRDADMENILHDLQAVLNSADYRIFNLECPLIERPTPLSKSGPVLGADSAVVNGLRKFADAVTLGNNHIMDHGAEGLLSTLKICKENNIEAVGVGKNLHEAGTVKICKVNDKRIAFWGIAEHEFSIATDDTSGAYGLDCIDNYYRLTELKGQYDYLIILLHSGNEQALYPSPRLKKTARFLADLGGDAIICQHSHCVGCYEEYNDTHILYGQGNLIFDYHNETPYWNDGILVQLDIDENNKADISFIVTKQNVNENFSGACLADKRYSSMILADIVERSKVLKDDKLLLWHWYDFCRKRRAKYFSSIFFPFSRILRILAEKFMLAPLSLNRRAVNLLTNLLRCELHREVVLTLLEYERKDEKEKCDNNGELR